MTALDPSAVEPSLADLILADERRSRRADVLARMRSGAGGRLHRQLQRAAVVEARRMQLRGGEVR